jgi:hypothetical protein
VPFTINDVQQFREKLGRYTENLHKFIVRFQTLELEFDLTWRDVQFLLADCCTPTERKNILAVPIVRQMRPSLGILQSNIQGMSLSQ